MPFIVLGIAIFALRGLLQDVSPAQVWDEIHATDAKDLALAVLAATASFSAIAFYDVISLGAVAPGIVTPKMAFLVGGTGYAISNLIGVPYLTGNLVRLKAYVSAGVPFSQVAIAIGVSWSGFWTGLVLLLGALLLFHPEGVSAVIPVPQQLESTVGAMLLLGLGLLLVLLGRSGRHVSWRKMQLDLPNAKTVSFLTVVGVLDLLFASLALWVLLPGDVGGNFAYFFVVFIVAIGLGIVSHSPGGLGVFEATMIAGLGAGSRPDVVAALAIYRVVYTLYPFLAATLGLSVSWLWSQRHKVDAASAVTRELLMPLIPPLSAGIALISGVLLLTSGNLPAEGSRLDILRDLMPLPFVEFSHLTASVVGIMLIILARGLYRRLTRAWIMALLLLLAGIVTSVVRGLDWEQAVTMGVSAGVLILFREAFYRVKGGSVFELDLNWFLSVAVLLIIITGIGLFGYKAVEYNDALWWQFSWRGDASRFLRGELVAAVVLGIIAVASLMRSRRPRRQPCQVPQVVRDILARSDDAQAALVLMGDKEVLLDPDERAFLAFSDTGRALVALGDPVGDAHAGRRLIWELREKADRHGRLFAFYGVSKDYLTTFLDMGLSIVKIGETARIDLDIFTLDGPKKKNFRYARSRGERDGYRVDIVPAAEIASCVHALRDVSDAWLRQKQGEEKGFALGAFSEDYIGNFDCAVLRNPEGEIVAFANLLKGGDVEIGIDLIRHDVGCPGYGMDMLFAEMILWAKSRGFKWFCLGNAPLSGIEQHRLASFWSRLGNLVYEHGERIYRFGGLRNFKEKWDPVWEPHYLASPRGLGVPRVLYEVNVLISGGVRGLVQRPSRKTSD